MELKVGMKLQTRDGLPARVLATDLVPENRCAAVAITNFDGSVSIWRYPLSGECPEARNHDLIPLKPEPRKIWIVEFEDGRTIVFKSLDELNTWMSNRYDDFKVTLFIERVETINPS